MFQNKSVVSWGLQLRYLMSDVGTHVWILSRLRGFVHMFCLMWTSLIYTGLELRDKNEPHKHLLHRCWKTQRTVHHQDPPTIFFLLALCSFLGLLLKQFFVYKTCTIPMFWKNAGEIGGVGQVLPLIFLWIYACHIGLMWVMVRRSQMRIRLFVFLGHRRPWLWHYSSSPTHYFRLAN